MQTLNAAAITRVPGPGSCAPLALNPKAQTRAALDRKALRSQNKAFAGTAGISSNNRGAGFVPGFCDTDSGVAVISRFSSGAPAPIHVLDGLPENWIAERDAQGRARKTRPGVVAGFLRDEKFYTREEAASALSGAESSAVQ